jgi:hypothetical protein
LRGGGGPVNVRENLPCLQQEDGPSRGQPDVMGGALQQRSPEFSFQPLQPLAQRGLDDMLAGRRAPEVQLFGQGDEVAQLAKLHPGSPPSAPLRRPPPSRAPGRQRCNTSARRREPARVITPADDRCSRWPFPGGGEALHGTWLLAAVARSEAPMPARQDQGDAARPAHASTPPPSTRSRHLRAPAGRAWIAGTPGSGSACANPAGGSRAPMTHPASTPEHTTKKPTTPSSSCSSTRPEMVLRPPAHRLRSGFEIEDAGAVGGQNRIAAYCSRPPR